MDEAAQAPPIDVRPVPRLLNDLGSEVLRSAADGGGSLLVAKDLGEPEISELDVAVSVDDDVFGLQAG